MSWKYTKEIRLEKPTQPDPDQEPNLWEVSFVIQTKENRDAATIDSGVVRYDAQESRTVYSDFHDHDLHNQVRFSVHRVLAAKKKDE
ncbi:MAG: hypothetical protein ABIH23_25940 [bacterium]